MAVEYEGGEEGVDEEGKGTVVILGDLSDDVEREVRRRVGPVFIGAKKGLTSYLDESVIFFPFAR